MKLLYRLAGELWFRVTAGALAGILVAALAIPNQNPFFWLAALIVVIVSAMSCVLGEAIGEHLAKVVIFSLLLGLVYPVLNKRRSRGLETRCVEMIILGVLHGGLAGSVMSGACRYLSERDDRPDHGSA